MEPHRLICHPSTPCPLVREFTVRVASRGDDLLVFDYQIAGDIDQLSLPAQRRSAHTDGLWKQTCLEAFIWPHSAPHYFEFNFSPSSEWAIYRFDDYRHGMKMIEPALPPKVVCRRREDRLEVDVEVHLAALGAARDPLQLALAAVLQDLHGNISYWALTHAAGKPDFHHAESFVVNLNPGVAAAQ